ncbi:MAG: hypothetical protein FD131_3513 [Rhodocyclaceae bacterium]|nr:MAG: hypothetical protein FD131_3513 [Rhodocyclaceae bacterium]
MQTDSSFSAAQNIRVTPKTPLIATKWIKHGDHPDVHGMNGSNWEMFPDEDDVRYGLLSGGCSGCLLVESGDWIVWNEDFKVYAIFKPEKFAALFSTVCVGP